MTNTRAKTKAAALLLCALVSLASHAVSLNKCVDAAGMVTYSNLQCPGKDATLKVEIDPAPPVPPAPKVKLEKRAPKPSAEATDEDVQTIVPKRKHGADNRKKCDVLSDKLGRVIDKMDTARRQGYTLKQMDTWQQEAKSLEHKKQQTGCF